VQDDGSWSVEMQRGDPRRWFFFRVSGAKDKDLVMHLVNAGNSSFPEAWEGYQVLRPS